MSFIKRSIFNNHDDSYEFTGTMAHHILVFTNAKICISEVWENSMRSALLSLAVAGIAAAFSANAFAQAAISQCEWPANLQNILEPWEQHTRTFANGNIRIAHVDTQGEPVCCSSYLAILAPTGSEVALESRQCALLTDGAELSGFTWIDFPAITASYDPGLGLLLSVPVERYDFQGTQNGGTLPDIVNIRINQANGSITTE